jgi:hypothetical protein
MAKGNEILSATDAGRILGVKSRQLRHLIGQGILPAQKIGNAYVVRRADLAAVPKDRKPGPKPKKY